MDKKNIEDIKVYITDYYNNLNEIYNDYHQNILDNHGTIIRILYFVSTYNEVILKTITFQNAPYADDIVTVKEPNSFTRKLKIKEVLVHGMIKLFSLREILKINEEFDLVLKNKNSLQNVIAQVVDKFDLVLQDKINLQNAIAQINAEFVLANPTQPKENTSLLFNSANSLYKEGKYNAARIAMERLMDFDDTNIEHNIFYFRILIRIDGNLTGNDYMSNKEKASKQFYKIIKIFKNKQIDKIAELKKHFFSMMDDYQLFRDKVFNIENRFKSY